jgi:hypothetical protein
VKNLMGEAGAINERDQDERSQKVSIFLSGSSAYVRVCTSHVTNIMRSRLAVVLAGFENHAKAGGNQPGPLFREV